MGKKWYNFFVVTREGNETPVAAPSPAPGKAGAPKRVVDVAPVANEETTFTSPVENPVDLGEIYASARITTPGHGYTILKVADMLESEHIRALPAEVKQKSILVALDAAGVPLQAIIEDAVQRDRALDTYERVLLKTLEDLRTARAADNRRLQEEIDAQTVRLRAAIEENTREVRQEEENLSAWRARKTQEEGRIAGAVSYFVSENPISTAGGPPNAQGG